MKGEMFEVILEKFKKESNLEDILILFSEGSVYEQVRNFVVVWPKVTLNKVAVKESAPEEKNAQWAWLWKHVKYDSMEITNKMGLTGLLGPDRIVEIAMGNRMIFPDGTISEYVQKAIRQLVASKLGLTGKKKGGR